MPMGISRLGLRGRSEWVATFFATVRKIDRRGPWLTSLHFRSQQILLKNSVEKGVKRSRSTRFDRLSAGFAIIADR
jgi:hypothetical protein